MALNRRRFISWVERRMLLEHGDEPAMFKLCHVGQSGSVSQVCKLEPMGDVSADEIATSLADEVQAESDDHTEGWPGRQQYVVRACTEDGREVGEFPFWATASQVTSHTHAASSLVDVTPEQGAILMGNVPEQLGHPTAMVATQQMRHNEALVRNFLELASRQSERDAQIIRQQQTALDKHEGRHIQLLELVESMHSQAQERQLATKAYEDDERRKERLLEKLSTWVIPALAERVGMPRPSASATDVDGMGDVRAIFFKLPEKLQNEVVDKCDVKDKETLLAFLSGGAAETKH